MKCELVKENIILANYGELPDEFAGTLEQHLESCEECRREWDEMRVLEEQLALLPVVEPSPNLLAQSRMRLDDALDLIPPGGFFSRLRSNFFTWVGHVQSAPALATLLVGVGFIGGNFTYRYQVKHEPKQTTVRLSNQNEGAVANVTGIVQTPNSEMVQVKYNRMVPESMEGSLDSPAIRELLLTGSHAAADSNIRANSVSLLADECRAGHACLGGPDPKGIRNQLLVSMLYDLAGPAAICRAGSSGKGCNRRGVIARSERGGSQAGCIDTGSREDGLSCSAGTADSLNAGRKSLCPNNFV
jgi:hypothetical protein